MSLQKHELELTQKGGLSSKMARPPASPLINISRLEVRQINTAQVSCQLTAEACHTSS
jgi:hypothetical protein